MELETLINVMYQAYTQHKITQLQDMQKVNSECIKLFSQLYFPRINTDIGKKIHEIILQLEKENKGIDNELRYCRETGKDRKAVRTSFTWH